MYPYRIGNTPSRDGFALSDVDASLDENGVIHGRCTIDLHFGEGDVDSGLGKLDKSRADLGSDGGATLWSALRNDLARIHSLDLLRGGFEIQYRQ